VDNVTHTLVGLIIGEPVAAHATHAVPRERGLPVQTRRTALLSVALLGSNSPDLDLLVSFRGSSTGRLLFALAVVGAVVLGLATGLMSGLSCFALAVGFLLLAASGSRLSASRASRLSVVLALAVTCAFALAGREAAQRAQGLAQAGFPGERLRDCEASAAHRDSRSGRRTRDRGRSMARRNQRTRLALQGGSRRGLPSRSVHALCARSVHCAAPLIDGAR
jgi:hypothetical protein